MAAPIVYDNVAEGAQIQGELFAGKKFWVAQRVFSRARVLDQIKSNGGEVVVLEKKADYMIADHLRNDSPPGSISYTFIDQSIEKGELQDPEKHRAGPVPGTSREPGSVNKPAKTTRATYTPEEDNILYKWVRDHRASGGLVGGNEIYKELEKKYPRHTWQSWRGRYLKTLQHRAPSAFNIPDNAPPSPPSDAPVEPASAPVQTQPEKARTTKPTSGSGSKNAGNSSHVKTVEYSVDDLTEEGLFRKHEWEGLYGFVDYIDSVSPEEYAKGWEDMAKVKGKTPEMWKQYFEKVVRPQWLRDPDEKHERIRKKVGDREAEDNDQEASQAEEGTQETNRTEESEKQPKEEPSTPKPKPLSAKRKRIESDDNLFDSYLDGYYQGKTPSAYLIFAKERKWVVWNEENPGLDYTDLHKALMSRWNALTPDEKAPYFAKEAEAAGSNRTVNETVTLSSQVWLSSSPAANKTPEYIIEAYEKALNELRENTGPAGPPVNEQHEQIRPVKRRKSASPPQNTEREPMDTSFASSAESQQISQDEQPEDGSAKPPLEADDELDLDGLEAIPPPIGLESDASDNASDTSTPRAPTRKAPAFDTQAILSSPPQSASLSALPLPARLTQLAEADEIFEEAGHEKSFTEADELPSDASTTQSLEEYRRSLHEDPRNLLSIAPLPEPMHSPPQSPASNASSAGSGDPDPPLAPNEVDEYFQEQHAEGFTDEYIAQALKHTRWRPDLATEVLQAWKEHKPLPLKRGIWTQEDDEIVEGGDVPALEELGRKHTIDGWGGVTERMNFLARYRSAKG